MIHKIFCVIVFVLVSYSAFAEIEVSSGVLTINVDAAKLGDIAKEIESKSAIRVVIDEQLQEQLVSIHFQELPVIAGFKKLAEAGKANYVFLNKSSGELASVLVTASQQVEVNHNPPPVYEPYPDQYEQPVYQQTEYYPEPQYYKPPLYVAEPTYYAPIPVYNYYQVPIFRPAYSWHYRGFHNYARHDFGHNPHHGDYRPHSR